ncbi:mitochondrial ribosome-associated GTPase 2 isoform X2 [Ictalurus punctatus]|uniref:Mitochondrial ribosome-associated GTPase 2 isoform X2 n=1 Tax=Ictalurus punctatus TaxID=7998 RepID=A0A2D0SGI5_ICTPU|nr:mitochondrial ribosome-associated GTPase 2 isoform X2 [Ictalurus punctatus]
MKRVIWRILSEALAVRSGNPVAQGKHLRLCGSRTVIFRNLSLSCQLCGKTPGQSKKKELSEKKLTRYFVDQRRVKFQAGSGGDGACSFHSEPRKEWGGPDGGDGGNGGDIIIKVNKQIKSLSLISASYRGENGESGRSKNCYGRNAGPKYILVGFPNAGKSSLLRAISNARPAVAAYPFTTLNPHVGVVKYRDHEQLAVADIPGIIRGAHLNRGLGLSFLRHIERCRFLLFVLDMSSPEPWDELHCLRFELDQYEAGLSQRPHAIVANKMDLSGTKEKLEELRRRVDQRIIPLSALTGNNTEELIIHLRELYDDHAGQAMFSW